MKILAVVLSLALSLESAGVSPSALAGTATLAPPSIFSAITLLNQAQREQLRQLALFLFERRGLSNEELRAAAQEKFPAWYHDPERPVWIYFDHIQRQGDDVLIIPFRTGICSFLATVRASSQDLHPEVAVKALPVISMSGGQEVRADDESLPKRLLRYARRVLFQAPVSFGRNSKRLQTGEELIWDSRFTPFWRDKTMRWMEALAEATRASGVPLHAVRVFQSVNPKNDERSFRLEMEWQPAYRRDGPPSAMVFHVDEAMAGGMILDTFLCVARAHALLPRRDRPIQIVCADGKAMPPFDRRKSDIIYVDRDDLLRPFDMLRSLHLYSEIYRLRLRSALPPMPAGKVLLHTLLFRMLYVFQLNLDDRQAVINRLGARSGSDFDHLTQKAVFAWQSSSNKLKDKTISFHAREAVGQLRAFWRDESMQHRPSLLKKQSADLAQRLFALTRPKHRAGESWDAFLEEVSRNDKIQEPWQTALVKEANDHVASNFMAEFKAWQFEKHSKRQSQKMIPERMREWATIAFRAWILRSLSSLKHEQAISIPAAPEEMSYELQTFAADTERLPATASQGLQAPREESNWNILKTKLSAWRESPRFAEDMRNLIGVLKPVLPRYLFYVPAISVLWNMALTAYAPQMAAAWIIFPAAMAQIFVYAHLGVIVDYLAQIFAREMVGKEINALDIRMSYYVELFNASLTAFAYRVMNVYIGLPDIPLLSAGVFLASHFWVWAGLAAALAVSRAAFIYNVSWLRGATYSFVIAHAQQINMFYREAAEQAAAYRDFVRRHEDHRDDRDLIRAWSDIRVKFNEEMSRLEAQGAGIRLKSTVAWGALRVPSIGKHFVIGNFVNEKLQTVLDAIFEFLGFTMTYRVAGYMPKFILPEEEALLPGTLQRRNTWSLMTYWFRAQARRWAGPKLRDLRRIANGLNIPSHPITHLLVDTYDRDPDLRLRAIEQFGKEKYAPVLPILIWSARYDPIQRVRLAAIEALQACGDLGALPALVDIMGPRLNARRLPFARHWEPRLSWRSESLAARKAVEGLLAVAKRKHKLSPQTMQAMIGMMGDEKFGAAIKEMLLHLDAATVLPELESFQSHWPVPWDIARRSGIRDLKRQLREKVSAASLPASEHIPKSMTADHRRSTQALLACSL